MVARCGALLSQWRQHILPIVEENRDAAELDITSQEARARKIVAGNEVYIGRRVISDNMRREMPAYLQYINGPRVLIAQPKNIPVPATITTAIEDEFTLGFRYDGWLEQHICISNCSLPPGWRHSRTKPVNSSRFSSPSSAKAVADFSAFRLQSSALS